MSVGIYKITNLKNNISYIGQSINIENRWRQHLKKYDNTDIHDAMQEYGIDNFKIEILELCPEEKLNEREQYYIALYDTYYNGYNMTKGGASQEHQYHNFINIYNLKGEYITTQPSIGRVVVYCNLNQSCQVEAVLKGKRKSANGYMFKYEKDEPTHRNIPLYEKSKTGPKKYTIYQYDLNNILINTYSSTIEAAKANNCCANSIGRCCRGELKTHHNFIWRRENNEIRSN